MNRRIATLLLGGLLVLTLAVVTFWGLSRVNDKDSSLIADSGTVAETAIAAGEALLYFPGRGARLHAERRALAAELVGEARLKLIVELLLSGPENSELTRTLPSHVELRAVTLGADGILFLDLSSKEGTLRGLGSKSELLAVYSLVDTVLLNEPLAHSVVLLWNGRQQPSLAGHVDTTRPLTLNRDLIAESS